MKYTISINLILIIILSQTFDVFCQRNLHVVGNSGVNLFIGNKLTIQAQGSISTAAGASIKFQNVGTPDLRLKGNFTNHINANYISGTEYIRFNGSTLQYADFGGDNVYGIHTDNASNVQITRNVTLNGELIFGTGHINSTSSAQITLGVDAVATSASDNKHNNGPISKNFNSIGIFVLPTGNGTYYMPIAFEPEGESPTLMKAEYLYNSPSNRNVLDSNMLIISNYEYWNLTRDSGTENGAVMLTWNGNSGISDQYKSDIFVTYWDGSKWVNGGGNNHTGNSSRGSVISNRISNFSRFTFGSPNNGNPLPVDIINFTAIKKDKMVNLHWQTANEINNDYFEIECSTNGEDWETIGSVDGSGNSNSILNYSFIDENPKPGVSYYRLKQVDYDKKFKYSNVEVVNDEGIEIVHLYPNPSDGNFNIFLKSSIDGLVDVTIYNVIGQIMKSQQIQVINGINTLKMQFEGANGKYLVTVKSTEGEYYNYYSLLLNN